MRKFSYEANGYNKSEVMDFVDYVIDETKNTIKIEDENKAEKIIPKKGSIFVFELPNGEKIEINGTILSIRPEDRIKKRFKKI